MQAKIIQFLKDSEGYLSGEEISKSLNISRAAIWKNIQELRKQGYEIVAVPHLGYQLASCPDKLFPQEIKFNLNTKTFGCEVIHHEAVESTMNEAFDLGMKGAPEGTMIVAESQTKGRGRLGRHWSSPKGKGVYASIILRPSFSPMDIAKLTLMAAVAVSEAVEKASGVKAQIKWPNDLLVNQKKLAGILTELRAEVDQVKFVIVGFGININNSASQLIDGATSLKLEGGKSISRIIILQEILRSLEKWYEQFKSNGFEEVIQVWKERSATLQKRVQFTDPTGVIEGEAIDLADDGGLLIRQDSGVVIKKMAGDVNPIGVS